MQDHPTRVTYEGFVFAYDFFNVRLFENQLPPCLITLQRCEAMGRYSPARFVTKDGAESVDEISLNPEFFLNDSVEEVLSTFVHEMCHLWDEHFGKPGRRGYHAASWADCMDRVGLVPSDTGKPGGQRTGQKIDHFITPDGPFAKACQELQATGFGIKYGDIVDGREKALALRKKKNESKTAYECVSCGLKAWGKPQINLWCGDCERPLFAASDIKRTRFAMAPSAAANDDLEMADTAN